MTPTPAEIRALRGSRTQAEMARLAGLSGPVRWAQYEAGDRRPDARAWELLLLRLDEHPTHRLVRRR